MLAQPSGEHELAAAWLGIEARRGACDGPWGSGGAGYAAEGAASPPKPDEAKGRARADATTPSGQSTEEWHATKAVRVTCAGC